MKQSFKKLYQNDSNYYECHYRQTGTLKYEILNTTKRKTYKGFTSYQAGMNQDGNEQYSVFSKLSPSFKLILK